MTAARRPPYAVLAGYYDEVYGLWRELLSPARDEILRAHRVLPGSVLDVGCGSGWQSLELARKGCRVVAVDPVAAFLRPLRTAARAERLSIDVRRGGVLTLPLEPGEEFDLGLATFDVLNHLESHAELAPALAGVARALRPGGHFLFDLNTPETVEAFPDHHRVTALEGGGLSAERGSFDPATGAGTVTRDWFLPDARNPKLFQRTREVYREIAWPRRTVERALRQAGLSVRLFADASGWLSFQPEGTRWLVLARKRQSAAPRQTGCLPRVLPEPQAPLRVRTPGPNEPRRGE